MRCCTGTHVALLFSTLICSWSCSEAFQPGFGVVSTRASVTASSEKETTPPSSLRIATRSRQQRSFGQCKARRELKLNSYIWWLDPDSLFVQSLGLTALWVTVPYITRITQAERAWEERLQEARRMKEDETGESISDLEFYKQSAASYPSMYGPQGVLRQREEKRKAEQDGVDYEDDETEKQKEIDDFEEQYGVDYDPFYDEAYTEQELPSDLRFYTNIGYGDRIYEDGQIFFKEYVENEETGEKDIIYYRRGAKPRLRKFLSWSKKESD